MRFPPTFHVITIVTCAIALLATAFALTEHACEWDLFMTLFWAGVCASIGAVGMYSIFELDAQGE